MILEPVQILHAMPPVIALLLLTAGILLIFVELNRPGLILAGACGLLLTLLAFAALRQAFSVPAAMLLGAATLLLLLSLRRTLPLIVQAATTLAIAAGFYALARQAPAFSDRPLLAELTAACGAVLGVIVAVITLALTRIARRARHNKGLD